MEEFAQSEAEAEILGLEGAQLPQSAPTEYRAQPVDITVDVPPQTTASPIDSTLS